MRFVGPRVRFRCVMCGECCRAFWVPLTHCDVKRIAEGTGLHPSSFVALVRASEVGDWGIPPLLVEGERRYMALARRPDGLCAMVDTSTSLFKCSIYPHRPMSCRFYPFVYSVRDLVEFELAEHAARFCPGLGLGAPWLPQPSWAMQHRRELEAYREFAARWNAGGGGDVHALYRAVLESCHVQEG